VDFTRNRKLPFARLIVFILSITASGRSKGVDSKAGDFFRTARRSGLWHEAEPVHRSGLTRARKKLFWTIFRDILGKAVELAYRLWPRDSSYLWHGMSVFAIDGSKFTLPATPEIRAEFDPKSGLHNEGKGHYPQCLVSTAYDVFRHLPIARSVVSIHGSERREAQSLLPFIPEGNVALYDRGYPSYEFIAYVREHYKGYFVFRCPAKSTFPAVEAFVRSNQDEGYILLTPSNKFLQTLTAKQKKRGNIIQLRIIKLVAPDGKLSVLLTNLHNRLFTTEDITNLYFRRWAVEGHYRDEKMVLEIEKFHGHTPNSIRQELFASVIMSVIARTLMVLSSESDAAAQRGAQFKNAIFTLASEAAVLVPDDPEKAIEIFSEILDEISRVKYYRSKSCRPSQPRVTKRPPNKWCFGKRKKVENP
jgi:hypothetical protein